MGLFWFQAASLLAGLEEEKNRYSRSEKGNLYFSNIEKLHLCNLFNICDFYAYKRIVEIYCILDIPHFLGKAKCQLYLFSFLMILK